MLKHDQISPLVITLEENDNYVTPISCVFSSFAKWFVFVFRDEERKMKVKRLYHMLSEQEGDYKALKRTKNKM